LYIVQGAERLYRTDEQGPGEVVCIGGLDKVQERFYRAKERLYRSA